MIETRENASPALGVQDAPGGNTPSFDIPSNKYSDIFGLWPPELFDGFEEFVKKSRERSAAERREPPPWW